MALLVSPSGGDAPAAAGRPGWVVFAGDPVQVTTRTLGLRFSQAFGTAGATQLIEGTVSIPSIDFTTTFQTRLDATNFGATEVPLRVTLPALATTHAVRVAFTARAVSALGAAGAPQTAVFSIEVRRGGGVSGITAEPWPNPARWEVVANEGGEFELQVKIAAPAGRRGIGARLLTASADPEIRLSIDDPGEGVDFALDRVDGASRFALLRVRGVRASADVYDVSVGWRVGVAPAVGLAGPLLPFAIGVVRAPLEIFRAGLPLPLLDWFQAAFFAQRGGVAIRRTGWADRFLRYYRSLWWMHMINPTTKQELSAMPVQAGQWSEADFRARDFVLYGRGITDPALRDAALAIRKSFPR